MLTEDVLVQLLARTEIEQDIFKEIKKILVHNLRIIGSPDAIIKVKVTGRDRK